LEFDAAAPVLERDTVEKSIRASVSKLGSIEAAIPPPVRWRDRRNREENKLGPLEKILLPIRNFLEARPSIGCLMC